MTFSPIAGTHSNAAARVSRALVLGILFIALLPYLLTPLYLVVNPVSTPMLGRWLTGGAVRRSFVPIDAMPRVLPLTVLIAEDARFCSHPGIDFAGLRDALRDAEDVEDLRGASTITQQVAKNLFLWPGRSYLRKALELPLALWVDFVLPKRRILEIYLNVAQWGPQGEFGVETGSRHAFGVSAREVNATQAALLAAVLPNPVVRDARRPGPAVRRLAAIYRTRAARSPWVAGCLGR